MTHVVVVLLGGVIGVLSGLFGVGGSSIGTPLLRLSVGTAPLIALASPLPVTIPTALAGSIVYREEGLINIHVVRWTIAGGVPTIIAGALVTTLVSPDWLMYLVVCAVVFVGLQLYRSRPPAEAENFTDPRWKQPPVGLLVLCASVIGFLSGLLANGGGFLLVPVFVLLFGARVREAAATSPPCVAALAIPGTLTHALVGHVDWLLALELSVGVIPATYMGARASIRLRRVHLRKPFGALLLVFGVFFFVRELVGEG